MKIQEKTSIIIITLNESERIGNLLGDLEKQSNQHFEVVLIDSRPWWKRGAIRILYVKTDNQQTVAVGRLWEESFEIIETTVWAVFYVIADDSADDWFHAVGNSPRVG